MKFTTKIAFSFLIVFASLALMSSIRISEKNKEETLSVKLASGFDIELVEIKNGNKKSICKGNIKSNVSANPNYLHIESCTVSNARPYITKSGNSCKIDYLNLTDNVTGVDPGWTNKYIGMVLKTGETLRIVLPYALMTTYITLDEAKTLASRFNEQISKKESENSRLRSLALQIATNFKEKKDALDNTNSKLQSLKEIEDQIKALDAKINEKSEALKASRETLVEKNGKLTVLTQENSRITEELQTCKTILDQVNSKVATVDTMKTERSALIKGNFEKYFTAFVGLLPKFTSKFTASHDQCANSFNCADLKAKIFTYLP